MGQSDIVINFTILLVAALVGGIVAHRLRQPVILGYLLVGIAIGPHALKLVNNLDLVEASATIGVSLLMLTLGLEVSLGELRRVGRVGLWGGILQIVICVILGIGVAHWLLGWNLSQSILFGLIIYPAIGFFIHTTAFPVISLGLPCPTTIFTLGFFMLANTRFPGYLLIIPSLWALVGLSAAFNFGIYQDIMILAAALTAFIYRLIQNKIVKVPIWRS